MTEWKCSADPHAVVPSDCNWPHCGCDPNVERVINGLQECGYKIIEPNDDYSPEVQRAMDRHAAVRKMRKQLEDERDLYKRTAFQAQEMAKECAARIAHLEADQRRANSALVNIDLNWPSLCDARERAEKAEARIAELEAERNAIRAKTIEECSQFLIKEEMDHAEVYAAKLKELLK